jgi:hypothetical protein
VAVISVLRERDDDDEEVVLRSPDWNKESSHESKTRLNDGLQKVKRY